MVAFRAYGTTIVLTIMERSWSVAAYYDSYVLSRKEFEWRNQFSFFFHLPHFLVFRRSCSVLRTDDTDPESGTAIIFALLLLPLAAQRIQPSDHEELHRGIPIL